MNNHHERYLNIRRATLIGAVADLFLGAIKIVFGVVGHSQALIIDGFHSLSDLFTDFMVILAAKWGSQQPDLEHPYGHGRIETLGTLIMAMIIIVVGLGFGYDALKDIFTHQGIETPSVSVLVVAVISIVSKEWLYHYTLKTTKSVSFDLAHSNAWHHRSDALASLVVLIGVASSMMGFHHADSIAAILVSLFIARIGFEMIWNSLRELIDTGVDPETLEKIKKTIQETPGVLSIHLLRTRSMGSRIFVDVHVLVAPMISVSEGHYIGDQVTLNLKEKLSQITDITVHIDPENDELDMISSQLPSRKTIEYQIRQLTKDLPPYGQIEKIELHYLAGAIRVILLITLDKHQFQYASLLATQYQEALIGLPHVEKVVVYWK